MRIVVLRFHGDLGEESERSLGAYHEVGYNLERVVEADEGQQIEPGDVLDGIFVADACCQFPVGTDFVAQFADAADEVAVGYFEGSAAHGVAGVQHSAVCQDDAGGGEHLVAVGVRAAVHARGVVHYDAAHHGALHAGGVGGKLASVGSQKLVYALADDARLKGDLFVVGRYTVLLPVLSGYNKDRVTDGLTGQTGSCCAEGDGQPVTVGKFQQKGNLFFVFRTDHYLRYQAVETGIRTPSQPAKFVGVNPFLRNESACFLQESHVVTFYHIVVLLYLLCIPIQNIL